MTILIILSLLISHSTSSTHDTDIQMSSTLSTCNCVEIDCITRSPQGKVWETAIFDEFLKPHVLSTHFIADIKNDNKKIYKYKIQWSHGGWSGWYFPGVNDNDWAAKANTDGVWNQAHKDAGRRLWTLFTDHTHEVCYLGKEIIVQSTGTCHCCEGVEIECISRSEQGTNWETAIFDAFLKPHVLSTHFIADIKLDKMKIYKYKIQWSHGGWSGWYFPGVNDNNWAAKSATDGVWNSDHKAAGRRLWTLFTDHNHQVCYLMDGTVTAYNNEQNNNNEENIPNEETNNDFYNPANKQNEETNNNELETKDHSEGLTTQNMLILVVSVIGLIIVGSIVMLYCIYVNGKCRKDHISMNDIEDEQEEEIDADMNTEMVETKGNVN